MTRKTTRMLTAFLSCSMAVTNLVPFNVMAETIAAEPQEVQVPCLLYTSCEEIRSVP